MSKTKTDPENAADRGRRKTAIRAALADRERDEPYRVAIVPAPAPWGSRGS